MHTVLYSTYSSSMHSTRAIRSTTRLVVLASMDTLEAGIHTTSVLYSSRILLLE